MDLLSCRAAKARAATTTVALTEIGTFALTEIGNSSPQVAVTTGHRLAGAVTAIDVLEIGEPAGASLPGRSGSVPERHGNVQEGIGQSARCPATSTELGRTSPAQVGAFGSCAPRADYRL